MVVGEVVLLLDGVLDGELLAEIEALEEAEVDEDSLVLDVDDGVVDSEELGERERVLLVDGELVPLTEALELSDREDDADAVAEEDAEGLVVGEEELEIEEEAEAEEDPEEEAVDDGEEL